MVHGVDTVNICGVRIDNVTMGQALDKICAAAQDKKNVYVVVSNIDCIVTLQSDREFREIYDNSYLALPDSVPMLWLAKYLGTPLKERVAGSDLLPLLCKIAAAKGLRVFFLGGRPGAAASSKNVLEKLYPGIKIVGTYAPPYGFHNDPLENEKTLAIVRSTDPDILFVALGAPKQEKWVYQYHRALNVPVSIGVGASFDLLSGQVKRAPGWIQRIGFEWFWRFLMEPARLWRRYFIKDMQIFRLVAKQKHDMRSRLRKG